MHKATSRFWSCFNKLPKATQKLARKNFLLLKENPKHPSLHFKKVGKLWSARVGRNYRVLAMEDRVYVQLIFLGIKKATRRLPF